MLTREDVFDIIETILYENLPDVPEEEVNFVSQKIMDKLEDKGAFDAMDVYDEDENGDDDDYDGTDSDDDSED